MLDLVTLSVNGVIYGGWKEVSISRSIKAICGAFSLLVSDRWSGQASPWPIRRGDECSVAVDGETVISGFVDGVDPAFDAKTRSIRVTGRDKACDLVDCSVNRKSTSWRGVTLAGLATDLGSPFGVKVTNLVPGLKSIPSVSFHQGDKAFEVLDQECRKLNVIAYSDGKGGIILARAGTALADVKLIQGINLLSGSGSFNDKDRFSDYKVISQLAGLEESDPGLLSISGYAKDPGVRRFRPLIVHQSQVVAAQIQANWEASSRYGKSSSVTCAVKGFHQTPKGRLWALNELVYVKSQWLDFDGDLLIVSIGFSKTRQGTVTTLGLEPPEAIKALPLKGNDLKLLVQRNS